MYWSLTIYYAQLQVLEHMTDGPDQKKKQNFFFSTVVRLRGGKKINNKLTYSVLYGIKCHEKK